jgi:cell division septal protein FtsQ
MLISEVRVEGEKVVEEDDVRQVALANIEGSVWGIFPKKNFLFIPTDRIALEAEALSPRIGDVLVKRSDLKTLEITIEERKPYIMVCHIEGCFYADRTGFVFEEVPESIQRKLYVPYEYQGEVVLGSSPVSKDRIHAGETMRRFLKGRGIMLESVIVFDDHFEAVLPSGGKIIFDSRDIEEAMNNFSSILESEDLEEVDFSLNSLEYIDLRYGDKVFWKPVLESRE